MYPAGAQTFIEVRELAIRHAGVCEQRLRLADDVAGVRVAEGRDVRNRSAGAALCLEYGGGDHALLIARLSEQTAVRSDASVFSPSS